MFIESDLLERIASFGKECPGLDSAAPAPHNRVLRRSSPDPNVYQSSEVPSAALEELFSFKMRERIEREEAGGRPCSPTLLVSGPSSFSGCMSWTTNSEDGDLRRTQSEVERAPASASSSKIGGFDDPRLPFIQGNIRGIVHVGPYQSCHTKTVSVDGSRSKAQEDDDSQLSAHAQVFARAKGCSIEEAKERIKGRKKILRQSSAGPSPNGSYVKGLVRSSYYPQDR